MGRSRDKTKEVKFYQNISKINFNYKFKPKRNDFIGRVRDDPWATTLSVSKSIRTLKSELALHGDVDKHVFSKNNKLDGTNYKTSLIGTKSVDRIIPFNHSNK